MNTRPLGTALACAVLALLLAACGSDTATKPAPTSSTITPTNAVSTPAATSGTPSRAASAAPPSKDADASGVPSQTASPKASWSPRPTPTATDITSDMGPGAHDGDGE
ncbi:hypothetical protein [Nocardioides jejuensis]|uniref:Uncharacterized protein n=1 Tax=Nocardioides jejuensis TaxID=2502782 RepID=A0A4R1BWB7_9ACTN|nr:hypothetical protein [Nocardioides jejuensis]TCJ22294.1 hypothetical protein EPD65_13225 [Nocardioides jejuensis]